MSNYHDYDDLFASYEKRTGHNTTDETGTGVRSSRSSGYTSSSSYRKTKDSAHSSAAATSKTVKKAKSKVSKTPEKSEKKYYGPAETPSSTRKKKTASFDDEDATVRFSYHSSSKKAPSSSSAAPKAGSYASEISSLGNGEKDKDYYREKYRRSAQARSKHKSSSPKQAAKKVKNTAKAVGFKKTLLFLIVVIAISCLTTFVSISCVNDVLAINRHSDKAVTITIDKQVDTKSVIKMLKKNDLIQNELFCNLFAKFKGYSDNYETGVFYLKKDMGIEGMILALKATSQSEETITINFPEGYSIMDIANKLEANEVCKAKNFIDTLENFNFEYDFLPAGLKADNRKYQYLEGYLFPATYEFYIGESPSNVIKKMLDAFKENVYTDEFKAKSESLGMSTDQILTLASIIQREAANKAQMLQIANVLNNRLNKPDVFPRLECDSTTDFLNKDVKAFLKLYPEKGTIDYFALYYNTYNNSFTGLPAGAICNPGTDAVKAVLNMTSSQYYYFCHDSSGEIHMATTLSEFEYIKSQYGINAQ